MSGSLFTVTLGEAVENGEFVFYPDGPDAYPIFDEIYRDALNKKITDHFYLREIGQETFELFRFVINRKMREIMPLYNQLYLSEKLNIDPLQTINIQVTGESDASSDQTTHTESTSHSDTDNASRAVTSDFPQNVLSANGDYASGATDSTGTSAVDGTGSGDSSQNGHSSGTMTNATVGSTGHTAALLMQYRASFLNIDLLVIQELEPCFMQVLDNGDEFAATRGYGYGWPYGWFGSI